MQARHHTIGTGGYPLALKPRAGTPHRRRAVRPGPFDVARGEAGRATADLRGALLTTLVAVYPVFAAVAIVLALFATKGFVS